MIIALLIAFMLAEGIEYGVPPLYSKLFLKNLDVEPPTGWILIVAGLIMLLASFIFPVLSMILVWTFIFSIGIGIYRLVQNRTKKPVKDWRDEI